MLRDSTAAAALVITIESPDFVMTRVRLSAPHDTTLTRSAAFSGASATLAPLPAGAYRLELRRVGTFPRDTVLSLTGHGREEVRIPLAPSLASACESRPSA